MFVIYGRLGRWEREPGAGISYRENIVKEMVINFRSLYPLMEVRGFFVALTRRGYEGSGGEESSNDFPVQK